MNSKKVAPDLALVNSERAESAEEISAPKSVKKLSNGRLVVCVKDSFQKIKKALPYIVELRARFDALPRGGAIAGCASWKTFCIVHLHRTDRAIRYALAEQTEPITVQVQQAAPEPTQNLTFKVTTAPISELHPYIRPDAGVTRQVLDTATRQPPAETAARQIANSASRIGDCEQRDEQKQLRTARQWLNAFLITFEQDNIGATDPQEIAEKLTMDQLEIARSCAGWLESVLSQRD